MASLIIFIALLFFTGNAHAAPVVVAAIAATSVTVVGTTVAFSFSWATFFTSLVLQALSGALNKPKQNNSGSSFQAEARDRLHTLRSSVETRKIVYGEVMLSGPLIERSSSGTNNEYLHLVIALCEGPVHAISDIYLNDEKVGDLDASGNVTTGRFTDYLRIKKYLGAEDQAADTDLIAENPRWTANHRLRGVAYLYVRLRYSNDVFPDGVPNIKALVKGKLIYDPRTASTQWTNNPTLCVRDYLKASYGLGCTDDEINDLVNIAHANICDERVLMATHEINFSADASNEICTFVNEDRVFETGDGVRLTTTGTLPTGLSTLTTYYVIRLTESTVKLATTYLNALAGTAIDITGAGSGVHTMGHYDQVRYTCNGVIDLGKKPTDILAGMQTSAAGAMVWSQGKYSFFAGAYTSPVMTLSEDDFRAAPDIMPKMPRRELYNAVRGTYIDPTRYWQPSDFPMVTNLVYEAQDNNQRIPRDIEFQFTTNYIRAQRIAKIHLDKSRQSITIKLKLKITAFKLSVWDRFYLNFDLLGWENKEFIVLTWSIVEGGIDITAQEESSNSYEWNSGNATLIDPAPNTNRPSAFFVQPPGTPVVTEETYETTNSTGVKARAIVSWMASPDAFVVSYQPEYKLSVDSEWIVLPRVNGTAIRFDDIAPGAYDFRVKAINALGAGSAYASVSKTILGLSAPPADVESFSLIAISGNAFFTWQLHDDLDVRMGGQIVIRHVPEVTDAQWGDGVIIESYAGNAVSGFGALKTGTYMAKAVDSTGNYSDNFVSFVATEGMVTGFTTVATSTQHPLFNGDKSNVAKVGSEIQLDSANTIGEMLTPISTWPLISALGGIATAGEYEFDAVMDLGSVATRRFETVIAAHAFDTGDTIGARLNPISEWNSISGDVINDCDATMFARTTNDDPSGSPVNWSEWTPFWVADFTCRAAEFKVGLSSGASTHNISISQLAVKAKEPV